MGVGNSCTTELANFQSERDSNAELRTLVSFQRLLLHIIAFLGFQRFQQTMAIICKASSPSPFMAIIYDSSILFSLWLLSAVVLLPFSYYNAFLFMGDLV